MAPNDTLNEMAQLNKSKFGKPHPRHGLKLLYWFARDCISFQDDQPFLKYNPWNGDFGFHVFRNEDKLLPSRDKPYYEVGNLHAHKASSLPEYVRKYYFGAHDNSNADRIIICLGPDRWLDWIYVTRHHGQRGFDQNHTYRISKGLLKIIHNFSNLNEFLMEVEYVVDQRSALTIPNERPANHSVPVTGQNNTSVQRPDDRRISIPEERPDSPEGGFWSYCTIL